MVSPVNAVNAPELSLGREMVRRYKDTLTAGRGDPVFAALAAEVLLRIDAARGIGEIRLNSDGVTVDFSGYVTVKWEDLGLGTPETNTD